MFEELLATSHSTLSSVDTYLPLDENQLARAAVTRLRTAPGSTISGTITVVYGAAGAGKTHLARWTLKELLRSRPRLRFVSTTVQDLCELMQLADERQSLAEFVEQCQELEVLVCEDLHWLETAPHLQPWFLMLIESLEASSTQILMTSRRSPGEIRWLDQRIVSRCHGGLCVLLPLAGVDSRVKLLQHWFQEWKLPILKPMSASAQFLAERLPVSPRDLKRAVQDLSELQSRKPAAIDVAYLQRWLSKSRRGPQLSFDSILIQVANEFGVEPDELRSRSRQQSLAIPRQAAMWLVRDLTGRPLEQIGAYFDRSHTTVSHSLSRLGELLPTVPSLRQQIQKLRRRLKEFPMEDCA
ncbi:MULTISPECIES: DnaA/Hda family protein [unclassified Schlesneria]|uniref:DnaA/Hda family protein n=1 Tax=unclassified Schlesneria TaxID=2762017 RepID=UPI002F20240D